MSPSPHSPATPDSNSTPRVRLKSRASHTKSRNGCQTCKARRVKHFILRLSHRMSLNPTKTLVWEKVIPEIAATNEFLMHLVLALAGLDLLSEDQTTKEHSTSNSQSPSEENGPAGVESSGSSNAVDLETVIEYHQRGLQGFREQLAVMSVANAEAMFAGSLLIVAFAFGSLRIHGLNPPGISDESSGFLPPQQKKPRLDWIYLVRGVTSIVHEHWRFLRMGRLRAIFNFNNNRDSWKEIPEDLASTPVPPRCHCSKYLTRFASGAQQALSNLRTFSNTLKLAVAPESPEKEMAEPGRPMTPSDILREQSHALEIVEENYMRIMFVLQFATSPQTRTDRMDVQADIEDALVMAWPQTLSYNFVRSMELEQDEFGVVQGYSFTILAHLYLIITLLEDVWYAVESFRHEIIKINTLVQSLGDSQLVSLMKWPMEVIS
ncbi:hypothetical protein MW887_004740 [Aspergillus wentii]|nr:hypothetical protein MW887_004740 [Aspergillus wentii]